MCNFEFNHIVPGDSIATLLKVLIFYVSIPYFYVLFRNRYCLQ